MVDYAGSSGFINPYSFTDDEREIIKKIINCELEFDGFILTLEKGIEYYLFTREISSNITSPELFKQVRDLQKTFKKLSVQLDSLNHSNESLIEQYYFLRERKYLPLTNQRGIHFYGWGDAMQSLMIDLDMACNDYFDDLKPIKGSHGYGAELNIVETIYNASRKYCPKLKISSGTGSQVVLLMDYLVDILNIKSKHSKKRGNAEHDNIQPSASGKAIVNSWLKHNHNINRIKRDKK